MTAPADPNDPNDPNARTSEERARDLYRSLQAPVVTDLDARLRVSQDARDKLAKIEAAIRAAHTSGRLAGLEEAARVARAEAERNERLAETARKNGKDAGRFQTRAEACFAIAAGIRALARSAPPPPPCTCGSGGHPRKCAAHPGVFAWHVEALNAENRVTDAREDAAKPIHAPDAYDLIAACLYVYNRPYPHVGFNALSEVEQAEWRRHAEGALGDVRAANKSEGGGHGKA